MPHRSSAIEFRGVIKGYGGLRPLRLRRLVIEHGAIVSLTGLDEAQASCLVDVVTGATLPDEAARFGADVARVAGQRQLTVLALTGDSAFSAALGGERMSWRAATGEVARERHRARWF